MFVRTHLLVPIEEPDVLQHLPDEGVAGVAPRDAKRVRAVVQDGVGLPHIAEHGHVCEGDREGALAQAGREVVDDDRHEHVGQDVDGEEEEGEEVEEADVRRGLIQHNPR